MEVKADRAELPTDPKALQRITLAQLIVRYRDTVSNKKKGYENERISLTAFLNHPICSRRLSEVRTEDFAAYRDQMLQTIKPTSLKRYLDPIHNLFEVARHEWGLPLRDDPLDRLKLKAPSQRRERRLLSGEWERILEAARLCRNPWIEPIIRLALATGMRRGEVLALEDNQIDRERRSLLIKKTKNGHARTIPLTVEAVRILEQLPKGRFGRLFPITGNAFRLSWERLRKRAGMEDFHFHDLRHEAISRFFELGLNPPEVALISGHRDMRQLFRYTHPIRLAVLQKLDGPTPLTE
jgi:integrase